MRQIFFPLLLASLNSYAQLDVGNGSDGMCTEGTLLNGGTYQCETLTISSNLVFNTAAPALIVKVQGSVTINTVTYDISGADGTNQQFSSGSPGGEGGPGASDGGGSDGFSELFPGMLTDSSAPDPFGGSGLQASQGSTGCGDGGGGGAFRTVASVLPDGTYCGGSGTPGTSGTAVTAASIFSGTFRGGAGGGAGGDGPTGLSVFGTGGGGGGAIRIIAGGDINILTAIDASGGNGGNGGADGGGGGAGSGGVIWLQSLGNINITGTLNVQGGTGGSATAGGPGGNGGDGFIRLDDADGVITGGGSFPNAITNALGSGAASSALKSDISCGTVKPSEQRDYMFLQLILAFLAVEIFARIVRKYSFKRFRVPFGKSEV